MNAKDLQKALHIMAWIIIWITGFLVFFLLMNGLLAGESLIAFITVAIVGALISLLLFTFEHIVQALDVIATNSYVSAKLMEKLEGEKSQEDVQLTMNEREINEYRN